MKIIKSMVMALLLTLPVAALAQSFSANLTGAAEVPGPGDPDGSGFAVIEIAGTSIRYSILTGNIGAPTAAHIHTGAAGVEGPVVVDLAPTFTGGGASGTVANVAQSTINAILANPSGHYVNVHNAEFPAGAVRGQLQSSSVGGGGQTVSYFPVVAKALGAVGTNFITDLRIVNTSSSTAVVTLDFFAQSGTGQPGPTAAATVTVAPGAQAVLNDVVATTLATTGLGALRLTSTQPVRAAVRILNDLRNINEGTAGFFIDQLELSDASTSGLLPLLSQASSADIGARRGFRTNMGYFNPGSTPVTATFTARSTTNGSPLGSVTITIPARSLVQQGVFGLINTVPGGSQVQEDFYVTYTSSAPIFVYASVVDNRTGDSVYLQ